MKAKFADLVNYFEDLAASHVDIRHTINEKHFFRIELDEILTGMRSQIKYPALILEGYDFNFVDQNSDNVHKRINSAFVLVDLVTDKGNYDKIHETWQRMEEIGDEICIKILHDKRGRQTDILSYFHMSDVRGNLLVDSNLLHYGVRYEFTLSWPLTNDIDIDKWK